MCDIIPSTNTEFEQAKLKTKPLSKITKALLKLNVNDVVRIVNHPHKTYPGIRVCSTQSNVWQIARRYQIPIRTKHDQSDLLVKRIK